MHIPVITDKQKEILTYLYTFRYLHTNQIQKLFNHKDKTTVKEWLKDLRDKGFINKVEQENDSFIDRSKPNIYCLAPLARQILKKDETYDRTVLDRIYRENKRKPKFIEHCLAITDAYLLFLARKEQDQELEFFTETELTRFDYFPQPLPSAYLSITTKKETQRYFLDIFDPYTPSFVLRMRVKQYLDYADSGDWEVNTNGEALPAILFICQSNKSKSHVYFYSKSKFEKAYEETIDLYLSTWDILRSNQDDIWEKVEIE